MMNRSDRRVPIYLLFFLSGISGLIYETVWLRVLSRVLGNTVYAISIVVAAFMAGLAIGSFLLGRYAQGIANRLRCYALLELGIGCAAFLLMPLFNRLVPVFQTLYAALDNSRAGLLFSQSVIMLFMLLIPTILMGGTLPLLALYTRRTHGAFANRLGKLYGLNTAGALIGVVGSGFYSIGELGELQSVLIGAALNIAVAVIAYGFSRGDAAEEREDEKVLAAGGQNTVSTCSAAERKYVLAAYAVSGFVALSYEIVWTRIFQIQVGPSIYAFSLMLGWYLAGIAAGGLWAGRYAQRLKDPFVFFGLAQVGIGIYGIIGMYLFTLFKPVSMAQILNFNNVIAMPLLIVFPVTFVLGLLFPVVSRIYTVDEAQAGRGVGTVYAVNTAGCILGSFACGFVFISFLGTKWTMVLLGLLNMVAGVPAIFMRQAPEAAFKKRISAVALAAALVIGILVPDPFFAAVKKSIVRGMGKNINEVEFYYHRENSAATTTAFGFKGRPLDKHLWANGIGMTSLCVETKLMAHIPLLLSRSPKDMLVICFGMGTTVRSAWAHKNIRCDVVELVPAAFECFKYFHANAGEILSDPRVRCYADDGRNFLLMRPKRYDVITMDPAPPLWSAGTVNLYTEEFFQLCRDHLTPAGIMCVWIPPERFSETSMIVKTFQNVFPGTSVWRGPSYPGIYLIGFRDPGQFHAGQFYEAGNAAAILADLNEWSRAFPSIDALKKLLVLTPEELDAFVSGFPVITDNNPYTEFPFWRSIFDRNYNRPLTAEQLEEWKARRQVSSPPR